MNVPEDGTVSRSPRRAACLILGLALLIPPAHARAQAVFDLAFDHPTVLVADLESGAAFYEDVLGLTHIDNPWGPAAPIRFFSLGEGRQLHVGVSDRVAPDKNSHLAFAVADFDGYLVFLKEKGVVYGNFAGVIDTPQVRPDGVRQVYFQDPSGNWIEVNDARHPPSI